MKVYNKVKWILAILIVFVLILATNLIDKNNFTRLRDSVITLYEDRLVAKSLLFEMSKSIQKKEIAILKSDTAFFNNLNKNTNADLDRLIAEFKTTKLTKEEAKLFNTLQDNLSELKSAENEYSKSDFKKSKSLLNEIEQFKSNLDDLSDIQLKEGSRQLSISKEALKTVELFTQIEIYFLIGLAIAIQVLILYNPKKKSDE
jgi:hypothetical protein